MITWGEAKRLRNQREHEIDLALVEAVFDAPMVTSEDSRLAYNEQRLKSIGLLNGGVVVLVWTERAAGAHVFSCRKAEKHEQRTYVAQAQI